MSLAVLVDREDRIAISCTSHLRTGDTWNLSQKDIAPHNALLLHNFWIVGKPVATREANDPTSNRGT